MSILSETDWDKVETGGNRDTLPVGEYHINVVKSILGKSQSGKDRVQVEMKVVDGDHKGRSIFRDYYLSPGALGMWKGACSALGGSPGDEASIIGKEGIAVLKARKDDGSEYAGRIECSAIKPIAPSAQSSSPKMPGRKSTSFLDD